MDGFELVDDGVDNDDEIELIMKNSLIRIIYVLVNSCRTPNPAISVVLLVGCAVFILVIVLLCVFLLLIGFRCLVLRVLTSSRYGSLPVLASKTLTKKVSVLVLVVFDLTQVLMLVKANLCYKRYSSFFHVPHVLSPTCSIV